MTFKIPTTPEEARQTWSDFYENPVIQRLADVPLWSISDKDKMPVSMAGLASNRFFGARNDHPEDKVTLDELTERYPDATNCAFRFFAHDTGYVVIDIEPTATDETKAALLELPWEYAETSMSGCGLHLLVPLPRDLAAEFPNAFLKPAMKAEDGTWEVLTRHWVTFTRNALTGVKPGTRDVAETLRPLAKRADIVVRAIDLGELPKFTDIPFADYFRDQMTQQTFNKSLEDYAGDRSRYDSAMATFYASALLRLERDNDYPLTNEQRVVIVLEVMRELGDPRDKWYGKEVHQGEPWIVYTVRGAIAYVIDSNLRRQKEREAHNAALAAAQEES